MRKIVWKKWDDPIQRAIEEFERDDDDDEDDSFEVMTMRHQHRSHVGPCLVGPMGVIPLNEHNTPSKEYNFWMAHTNFRLTVGELNSVKLVNGVEAVNVFSPYRCRIAIGMAFDVDRVKQEMDTVLGVRKVVEKNFNKALKNILDKTFVCWGVQVNHQGKLAIYGGKTPSDVNKQMTGTEVSRTLVSW